MTARILITGQQINVLVSRYFRGDSIAAIAGDLGVSRSTMSRALVSYGAKIRSNSEAQINRRSINKELVADLYRSGKSIAAIAKTIGCGCTKVRNTLIRYGVKLRNPGARYGEENHQFKGGFVIYSGKYRFLRGHRSPKQEHRAIAEKCLGRNLKKGEVVHHINCNKLDNRPQNLIVCTQKYHAELHARMRTHPYWSKF